MLLLHLRLLHLALFGGVCVWGGTIELKVVALYSLWTLRIVGTKQGTMASVISYCVAREDGSQSKEKTSRQAN